MKSPTLALFALVLGLLAPGVGRATTDATCLIYQPIDMRSEGTVIKMPTEGFIIFAIPYLDGFSVPKKPYDAIAKPHRMLSMRQNRAEWDANLVSRTSIQIRSVCAFEGNQLKEEAVTLDLSNFKSTEGDPSLETIVEATLECIRRTATDVHQNWPRPILTIVGGMPEDDAMWNRWAEAFNTQDFAKVFKRPPSPEGHNPPER